LPHNYTSFLISIKLNKKQLAHKLKLMLLTLTVTFYLRIAKIAKIPITIR
jgi:hypothetical protein